MSAFARTLLAPEAKIGAALAHLLLNKAISCAVAGHSCLGKEADLIVQFGVSRATLRESIRQLEAIGIVEMRRGIGGGLMVSAELGQAAGNLIALHLEMMNVPLMDLYDVNSHLCAEVVALAAARIDDHQISLLRRAANADAASASLADYARTRRTLRREIITASRCELIGAFIYGLEKAILTYMPLDRLSFGVHAGQVAQIKQDEQEVIEAIVAHDVPRARFLFEKARASEASVIRQNIEQGYVAEFVTKAAVKSEIPGGALKTGARIARDLRIAIQRMNLTVNTPLGLEADLAAQFGTSKAVIREAIRALEFHGFVKAHRGHGGGIRVGQLRSDSLLKYLPLLLPAEAIARDFWACRTALEGFAATLAAQRTAVIAPDRRNLSATIAQASGNAVIALLAEILLALQPEDSAGADLEPVTNKLLNVIAAGDGGLARRYALERIRMIAMKQKQHDALAASDG